MYQVLVCVPYQDIRFFSYGADILVGNTNNKNPANNQTESRHQVTSPTKATSLGRGACVEIWKRGLLWLGAGGQRRPLWGDDSGVKTW